MTTALSRSNNDEAILAIAITSGFVALLLDGMLSFDGR